MQHALHAPEYHYQKAAQLAQAEHRSSHRLLWSLRPSGRAVPPETFLSSSPHDLHERAGGASDRRDAGGEIERSRPTLGLVVDVAA